MGRGKTLIREQHPSDILYLVSTHEVCFFFLNEVLILGIGEVIPISIEL